jgi:hypothetical protein
MTYAVTRTCVRCNQRILPEHGSVPNPEPTCLGRFLGNGYIHFGDCPKNTIPMQPGPGPATAAWAETHLGEPVSRVNIPESHQPNPFYRPGGLRKEMTSYVPVQQDGTLYAVPSELPSSLQSYDAAQAAPGAVYDSLDNYETVIDATPRDAGYLNVGGTLYYANPNDPNAAHAAVYLDVENPAAIKLSSYEAAPVAPPLPPRMAVHHQGWSRRKKAVAGGVAVGGIVTTLLVILGAIGRLSQPANGGGGAAHINGSTPEPWTPSSPFTDSSSSTTWTPSTSFASSSSSSSTTSTPWTTLASSSSSSSTTWTTISTSVSAGTSTALPTSTSTSTSTTLPSTSTSTSTTLPSTSTTRQPATNKTLGNRRAAIGTTPLADYNALRDNLDHVLETTFYQVAALTPDTIRILSQQIALRIRNRMLVAGKTATMSEMIDPVLRSNKILGYNPKAPYIYRGNIWELTPGSHFRDAVMSQGGGPIPLVTAIRGALKDALNAPAV